MIVSKAARLGWSSSAVYLEPALRQRAVATSINLNSFHARSAANPSVMASSTTSSALSSFSSSIIDRVSSLSPTEAIVPLIGIVSLLTLFRYRNAIRKRIQQIEEESLLFGMGLQMKRIKSTDDRALLETTTFRNLKLLELNPEFRSKYEAKGWQLTSLGEYLASLRPKMLPKQLDMKAMPLIIQSEIEAGLSAALLKALGPNLGRAVLPAVGTGLVQNKAKSVASGIATRWLLSKQQEDVDKGGIPINLLNLLALSDANAKFDAEEKLARKVQEESSIPPRPEPSAMEKMKLGEIGYTLAGSPSFAPLEENDEKQISSSATRVNGSTRQTRRTLVPQNFVVSSDFEAAVTGMEDAIRAQSVCEGHSTKDEDFVREGIRELDDENDAHTIADCKHSKTYNSEGRDMAEPMELNPRLFPDLYFGWGDAKCPYTNQEVIRNRLMSVLLNRLGANYNRHVHGDEENLFTVQMIEGGKMITKPSDFIQALVDSGHEIEVVPTSHVTTFGISLCVKEGDGSFSNIPLACFLESGYEDKDGNMASVAMPHSGLDMDIKGPLIGKRTDGSDGMCSIQHFIAVDGFCGWHSNHNAEVPWLRGVECGHRVTGTKAVRATRLAGLYANVLNGLATDLDLPRGGYGLTAVCNDSAAVIEQCLYGTNSIYPMTSIGRFMMRTARYVSDFREKLEGYGGMEEELEDLCAILNAMKKLPSDINASPTNAESAARRILHTLPPDMGFQMMVDCKKIMESILEEEVVGEVAASKVAD
ncbi:predicted protein [Phaeodactylum tricornutum CCAP 1055/1]|jgi:hypothetical protein|uniref:Uncharacterized protein n=2 Tax=Phaeodactylum tricornutum TaxID=2850 RepID=B7FZ43_PHATC|nr:predicted protein [Phaeodactylum tricornutum CCAP 1055/1]EEC48277.1 predicted protein [Phaeodactylum tricornutum CCAP 1055/1]|eukprot:XP_002180086.1 predicted protein [Phaeodactylum tricornutum CCAP 1055/1]